MALIRAASSEVQRPLIQAPPHWSSVMVRCRPRWAARSSRSSSRSARRSSPSGSTMDSSRWVSLRSSVASSALASPSRNVTARARTSGSPGRVSMARSITCALVVESQPSPRASATGASSGVSSAAESRTAAGPVPLWPPATEVTKSWVEAQPDGLDRGGGVELSDHGELDRLQRRFEGLDRGDAVHQLVTTPRRPQGLTELTDLAPQPLQHRRNTASPVLVVVDRLAAHGSIQAPTTDKSPRRKRPCGREFQGLRRGGLGCPLAARPSVRWSRLSARCAAWPQGSEQLYGCRVPRGPATLGS